jgi:hypothetical protein
LKTERGPATESLALFLFEGVWLQTELHQ